MNNIIKIGFILLAMMLSSCGGGGSDCGSKGILFGAATCAINNDSSSNPLKKYEGTYYICEQNLRKTINATAVGSKGLNLIISEDVYSSATCSGTVVGSYRMNAPILVTFTDYTIANLPAVTVLPFADRIEKVNLNTSSITASLTGSGVTGSCVNYSYANGGTNITSSICYDLSTNATDLNGALYLSSDNQYFLQLSLHNGVYSADTIASRSSDFNYSSLIGR